MAVALAAKSDEAEAEAASAFMFEPPAEAMLAASAGVGITRWRYIRSWYALSAATVAGLLKRLAVRSALKNAPPPERAMPHAPSPMTPTRRPVGSAAMRRFEASTISSIVQPSSKREGSGMPASRKRSRW